MRYITKSSSTKPERIFIEILKANHIPFKYSTVINGREIDFIIGKYAIEIDGHEQSIEKNRWLFSKGFVPVHYNNHALLKDRQGVERDITQKIHGLYT
jgi:very-short-patch-repair endonuclease